MTFSYIYDWPLCNLDFELYNLKKNLHNTFSILLNSMISVRGLKCYKKIIEQFLHLISASKIRLVREILDSKWLPNARRGAPSEPAATDAHRQHGETEKEECRNSFELWIYPTCILDATLPHNVMSSCKIYQQTGPCWNIELDFNWRAPPGLQFVAATFCAAIE